MTSTFPRHSKRWAMLLTAAALLGLATAWGADPTAPPRAEAPAKKATVPFQMLPSNHMLVRARINGKGPYRLIFDLGAPITLISNRAAEDSGTVKTDARRSFFLSMRGEAEVSKLEVGDLTAEKLPVIVFDHPVLKALSGLLGRPLDGIMGFTFFARYRTTIDYEARKMTFEPVKSEIRDLMKDLQNRLAGPKVAKHRVLAPAGLWGLSVGDSRGGVDGLGVPITAVSRDSPADAAGLKPGDILTTLDGRWTASVPDAYAAAAGAGVGQPVTAVIVREGREMTLSITPRDGF